jgi:hypothetical protein
MRKISLFLGLFILSGIVTPVTGQGKMIARWTFDTLDFQQEIIPHERKRRPAPEIHRIYSAIDDVSGQRDRVAGTWFNTVPGIKGNGLQLDGYSSFVVREHDGVPRVSKDFSISAWISLAAYPWNWCPIVDFGTAEEKGFSLGLDAYGHPAFRIRAGGKWMEAISDDRLSLRKWYQITGVYQPGRGITLYVNGEQAGTVRSDAHFEPAENADFLIGRYSIKARPTGTLRPHATAEVYTFFDGIIDDVYLMEGAMDREEIEAYLSDFEPGKESMLKQRKLPAGQDDYGKFGAYYTSLEYYDAWDALWRVDDHADVVVNFDEFAGRFVFWRGTSYIPHWVTGNGIWYNNEFTETWSELGCHEPMSDKRCQSSHVRIIENHSARIVVHWRYALLDNWYHMSRVDSLTGWGDWADEVYTIYPDGVAVRSVTLYSNQPTAPAEWHEGILVMGPGQRPEDILEPEALTLANIYGETHTFSWEHGIPAEADDDGFVHVPREAIIHLVNTKSAWKPFVIVSPESDPAWDLYSHELRRDVSIFPWWNHWPTAMNPCDGRNALDSDRASHSSLTHCYWNAWKETDHSATKLMLNGLTPLSASDLVPLAKSWSYPPGLTMINDGGFEYMGYDPSERACQIAVTDTLPRSGLEFMLNGNPGSPVINPCIVIRNWGDIVPEITVDGEIIPTGDAARYGFRNSANGVDLIVWLKKEAETEIQMRIEPATGQDPN